jgi:hypothetical protein
MLTVKRRKAFSKLENKKFKIYRLKGGGEVKLLKPYSLRKKGKFIYVFRGRSREPISYFCQGVSPVTIERFVSGYEVNLQRKEKEKEKKIAKPGKKMGGFMEAIEERNALLKRKPPENEERFFKRNYSGKWR